MATEAPGCPCVSSALGCAVELSPTGARLHRARWFPHAVPRRGGGPCCPRPDGLGWFKVQTDDSRGNSRPRKQMASVAGSSDFAECQVLSSGLSRVLLSSRSQTLAKERFAALGSPQWNSRLGECRLTRETRAQFHIQSRVFKIATDGSQV